MSPYSSRQSGMQVLLIARRLAGLCVQEEVLPLWLTTVSLMLITAAAMIPPDN